MRFAWYRHSPTAQRTRTATPRVIPAHRHPEPLLTTLLACLPQVRSVVVGYSRLRAGLDQLCAASFAEYQPPPRPIYPPCLPRKTAVEYRYTPGFSAPQTLS